MIMKKKFILTFFKVVLKYVLPIVIGYVEGDTKVVETLVGL